jgi:hypothetical protein
MPSRKPGPKKGIRKPILTKKDAREHVRQLVLNVEEKQKRVEILKSWLRQGGDRISPETRRVLAKAAYSFGIRPKDRFMNLNLRGKAFAENATGISLSAYPDWERVLAECRKAETCFLGCEKAFFKVPEEERLDILVDMDSMMQKDRKANQALMQRALKELGKKE